MATQVELRWEGLERVLLAIDRIDERSGRVLRDWLESLGSYGVYWMKFYAPHGASSLGSGQSLQQRIDRTGARWHPGGAGGGGAWEVTAGVKGAGGGRYPIYVNLGTGLYRPVAPARIRSDSGRAMSFQKLGHPRAFFMSQRGQRPQPFLYQSWQQVLLYARGNIHTIGRELLHGV